MLKKLVAVLTGDLIASTQKPAETVDAAMGTIARIATAIADWQKPHQDTRFTRFRGDGWQILLIEPRLALRAACVIQGRLMAMGMETRINIGIGQIESLGTDNLAAASGEAFERSGRGLDKLGDAWKLGIDKDGLIAEDKLITDLLAERMGRWTAAQAEATSLYLASPFRIRTLFDIGTELKISPQAVNDRLRGAGCHTISFVLKRWESLKIDQGWEAPHA